MKHPPHIFPTTLTPLILLIFLLLLFLLPGTPLPAADWPTYRADYSRSGITTESPAFPLTPAWTFQSRNPPRPAWSGEAKWDGYNKLYNLKHRQDFDNAFHVITAGNQAWFGSSADDKVYCLDAATGTETWSFYTEGPVRLAPTFHNGRIYAGSDDGHAYCLSASQGTLIWKTRLGPRDYRIPGNGRVISAWPLRTSLITTDETVYACAGLFPSEGVFLCALNASDGRVKWTRTITDLPAQGYLLASATRLYVPTGRNNPIVFNRTDGTRLQTATGSGGTYALLAGNTLVFGPGKTGQLGVIGEGHPDQLATFDGNHLIVSPEMSYLHSDTELSALNRQRYIDLVQTRRQLGEQRKSAEQSLKPLEAASAEAVQLRTELAAIGQRLNQVSTEMAACVPWRARCDHPCSLILAGTTLVAGGNDEVAAYSTVNGSRLWNAPVTGKAHGLTLSHQRLFVSTDQGTIHCFTQP